MPANILVVEDEPLNRQLICDSLRAAGYKVTEAKDGQKAAELLEKRPFHLVVSDFLLPKMHGMDLVNLIHTRWPQMPIVVISGYLSDQAGGLILDGLAEFVEKPFELVTLASTVQRLLGDAASPRG
jgi:DNA-binding NtrC family response regulator